MAGVHAKRSGNDWGRTMREAMAAAMLIGGLAGTAQAQSEDLCSSRPGLTTDPCLVRPGRLTIETSAADWTLDRRSDERTDTVLLGDSILRYGIASGFELDVGWTPVGSVREREDGEISRRTRVGDVTVGARASLLHPDGDAPGPSASTVVTVSLPVGRAPVGAGDWGITLLVPLAWKLDDRIDIEVTPELDAAVDEDGAGRHLAYGFAAGVDFALTDAIVLDIDGQVRRDRDPDREERGTLALANFALAVQADDKTQFDIGTNLGLNRKSPDVEVVAGFTRAF